MLAAKKTGAEAAVLVEVPTPCPARDDVLVRVRACAICASDFEGWRAPDVGAGTPGHWDHRNDGLTGHEVAGEIVAVGGSMDTSRVGERVWVDGIAGCGICEACRQGCQAMCARARVLSQGFAEFMLAPARQCRGMPPAMDFVTASLLFDMVGTPMGAARRARIRSGEAVAVWGLGPVGLGMVQAARIAGAGLVVGLDPIASRRARSESYGAHLSLDPAEPAALERLAVETDMLGPHVALSTVASAEAAAQAFRSMRPDGRMVTVAGFPPAGGDVPKWVTGSWVCCDRDWPEIISHVLSGAFVLDGYVTHCFPLSEIVEAFRARLYHPEDVFKVVVTMS